MCVYELVVQGEGQNKAKKGFLCVLELHGPEGHPMACVQIGSAAQSKAWWEEKGELPS